MVDPPVVVEVVEAVEAELFVAVEVDAVVEAVVVEEEAVEAVVVEDVVVLAVEWEVELRLLLSLIVILVSSFLVERSRLFVLSIPFLESLFMARSASLSM